MLLRSSPCCRLDGQTRAAHVDDTLEEKTDYGQDTDYSNRRQSSRLRKNQKVEAKCTGWTKFYKGEVTRVNRDGSYDIKFEDGELKRDVEPDRVRSLQRETDRDRDRATSSAKIREGDKVEAKCSGWTKYYKGEVTSVNRDGSFDIKFEDGERKRDVEPDRVRSLERDQDRDKDQSTSSAKIREGDKVVAKCAGWTKYYKG